MSGRRAAVAGNVFRVLVVGDSRAIDATADALSSELGTASLFRERTVSGALERLAEVEVHCVVCEDAADGRSSIERLRERDETVPIVVVTEEAAADRAIGSGATDVVAPDASPTVLAARVRTAAERERYRLVADSSAAWYRSLLESSDALVWVVDEDGEVVYASPAVESRLGATPDELDRTDLTRFVHPDDRADARNAFETVATGPFGATERVTARLRHADGTWRVVDAQAVNRLEDPLVGGIVVTITAAAPDRPLADDGREAIDRLEGAFFALGERWELRDANAAATRLFEGEPRPGTVVWDLVPDAVRGTFYERLREASTTGDVVEFETPYPPLDAPLRVEAHPSDTGVTVYARESSPDASRVTDRDRLELFEAALDALDDGVAVLEGTTVREANATLFELADAETLVGRDVESLFDDELAAAIRERTRSPVVRWMDPLGGVLEAAGDARPVDVFVAPLPDDERTLCIVRDRRRSRAAALETIGRAVASIRDADSRSAVRRAVVEAALALTDADLAGWYRADGEFLRPTAFATPGSTPVTDPSPIDRSEVPLEAVLEGDSPSVHDRPALEPFLSRTGIRAERVLTVPVGSDGVLIATGSDPLSFDAVDLDPLGTLAAAAAVALERFDRADRVRDCRRDCAALESLLERSDRLRVAERELLEADTREAVERRLCEAVASIAASDGGSIELAWVGDVAAGSETVAPRQRAGRGTEYLESVSIPIDESAGEPTGRTAATREPTVVDDVERGAAGEADEEWRRFALERGFRSALAVPLAAGEFLYGTLTAYADRPSAFDDRTRRACEHLAAVAGYAIGAIETRRALLSDRVTELEIASRDESEPLSAIARRLDRRIDVRTVVPRSAGGSTVFCTVADASDDAIADAVESVPSVDSVRRIEEGATGSVLELVLAEPTIAEPIADHGGRLRSVVPTDGRTRFVLELSSSVDVRSFVGMLERRYRGIELAARRERDRSAGSARAFDAELRERLSERQLRTLETAYYSGFFEWPRESTGEEVAASLGVSQPTFSRHFRIAQRKLFSLLFEERDGTE